MHLVENFQRNKPSEISLAQVLIYELKSNPIFPHKQNFRIWPQVIF